MDAAIGSTLPCVPCRPPSHHPATAPPDADSRAGLHSAHRSTTQRRTEVAGAMSTCAELWLLPLIAPQALPANGVGHYVYSIYVVTDVDNMQFLLV